MKQNMRHAIMVIGYGKEAPVLQQTINVLDDKDITFFIHWDKKYRLPELHSKYSKIIFTVNRYAVYWGSQTLVQATYELFKLVKNTNQNFDYIHLISSNDAPLMDKQYFKNFFVRNTYVGFDPNRETDSFKRLNYYYPAKVNFKKYKFVCPICVAVNKLLGINRLKNEDIKTIKRGPEWFSIKFKYLDEILNYNWKIFYHGYCADELILPTILNNFEKENEQLGDDNVQSARFIDWDLGRPYTFKYRDLHRLLKYKNTNYAFFRKVNDPRLIKKIFSNDNN